MNNTIEVMPVVNLEQEQRINKAIEKLKKFDKDIVLHLEQLGDLAERNKPLFNLGLNFLKRR